MTVLALLTLCGCGSVPGESSPSRGKLAPAVDAARPIERDSGEHDLQRHRFVRRSMGVAAAITLYAPSEAIARAAATAAFARLDEIEASLSDYRSDSEIVRLAAKPGRWHPASRDLTAVLLRAREVGAASGGAFDVTLGPLTRLWRDARRTGRLPTLEAIADARQRSGAEHLLLRISGERVEIQFTRAGMGLDFGGIGKGYGADEALRTLVAMGVPRAIVALAGDLAIGDPPPGAMGWQVAIESGLERGAAAPETLLLAHCGVSTSGDLEQFIEIDGVRYSHLLDPATGVGLVVRIAVTTIAADATTADALASATSVLGAARAGPLLAQFGGWARVIDSAGRAIELGERARLRSAPW